MEFWVGIIIFLVWLLSQVFSVVTNWRPEVKEPEEEEKGNLDALFGEEPELPPVPEEQDGKPAASQESMPGLARAQEPAPAPEAALREAPPVRPEATPAQPPPTPPPNYWEQKLQEARKERQRRQPSAKEKRLAEQFEKSKRTPAKPPVPRRTGGAAPLGLRAMLQSPQSTRQAVVLREVLGPAPGLLPAGQAGKREVGLGI